MHRLFKSHNLMNIFFAVLMSIPLISIGVRCAYVVINKNALQNYSGNTANNETFNNIEFNEMNIGYQYYTYVDEPTTLQTNGGSVRMYVNNVQNYGPMNYVSGVNFTIDEVDWITLWTPQSGNNYLMAFELHKTGESQYYYINSNSAFNFSFYYEGVESGVQNTKDIFSDFLYQRVYLDKSYLDNVFEYSINQFVSSNDFGNLNFFTWFNGVFFTNNAQASTYINFINWYLNYMILVSCGYILFLMLMWFVNFVRKLLDRSMNIYDK